MYKLEKLTKNSFFKYFKEISDIPRESGNEKEISDYLVNFAKERNLEVIQDKYLNVIIKKKAYKGYEHLPTVILQGHMDMVCVKNSGSDHDFEKDPIKLKIIDDMIFADETTLGADDGVALAYSLAILDDNNLKHPALEIVITTEEESTMMGAMNIDASVLNGKVMLNLDSDRENELLVSSTGGIVAIAELNTSKVTLDERYEAYEIIIDDLIGGHSGEEIQKERGNANKLLGRLLDEVNKNADIYLANIIGGTSSNAIPRSSKAQIFISKEDTLKFDEVFMKLKDSICDELKGRDEKIKIEFLKSDSTNNQAFTKENLESIINFLVLIPNGVQSMSVGVKGLVESSNNIGTIRTIGDVVKCESEIRSCVKSKRIDIERKIEKISNLLGFEYSTRDEYPEWNYNQNSTIRTVFLDTYKKLYNEDMRIKAVHAGLETGIFIEKIQDLDIVSYGPNAYELHNPKEHLNIPSCFKTWDVLVNVLENTINYY